MYIHSDEEVDDVSLNEFSYEIEAWVLKELKAIGCDTARSVINISVEELMRRTDLEEETINNVVSILKDEFED